MSLHVGQAFAGYTIQRVLGAGGMGTVYLATHPRLPRQDALKVLPAEFTDDAEYRARFTREAELAAGLSHPHIVGVQDRGEFDGQFWISMDYVAGTDVSRSLKEQYPSGMPVEEVLTIVDAVATALDYAHDRGLLHRDVKPANILLADPDGQDRRIYLADFGVARRIDDSAGLTETNVAVGTVAYAAPEQLKGEPVDGRADQYALACTAFHLLTGAPPYPDDNPAVVITHHLYAPPPSLSACKPDLRGLDPVLMRAMAKEPSGRFATCTEFASALRRHFESGPEITGADQFVTAPFVRPPRKRSGALIAALVGVVLLVGGGIFAGYKLMHRPAAVAAKQTSTATTSSAPGSTTTTTSDVPLTAGPLNGTYRADFGAATGLDGDGTGGGPFSTTYGIRSVCGGTCVATATRLGRGSDIAKTMVFDEVDGRWLAVATLNDDCLKSPSEFWLAFTVQLDPDGTLNGEMTRTSATNCRDKRPVIFTRTGDVDMDAVADPATMPPRVVSPAEALHGHYQLLRTYPTSSIPTQPAETAVTTTCLRTGDRCMSYFYGKAGDNPLVFQNGIWALTADADYPCPAGGTLHFNAIAEFPLPQPPENPIQRLSGHGHQQQTGACAAVDTPFDQTFTRTGD
ncbi:serine/threonine protein kinase [Mycobacterium gordonae]|uniref:serine/threonine-protein kinase n=1 Tax=Mycobacterium gordonae TaxID=1778 RepID=UPI00210883B5|nr:serine/threonine-protein kinase [Mycobacterium gordonae]MCQ4360768.1 serine/threonine protein kinase [Mycobacterium gordonae]